MKKALKKISAAFLALAMIVSITPMTGFTVLADENETEAPAATEEPEGGKKEPSGKPDAGKQKETEKPAEKAPEDTKKPEAEAPKETEAPAETEAPKETEAPAETKAPSETEAPKETEAPSETEAPKETESPAETEAPSETEAPKETEAPEETEPEAPSETEEPRTEEPTGPEISASRDSKNGTIRFSGISSDGILEWEPYDDENLSHYIVSVIQNQTEIGEYVYTNSFNIYKKIDILIKEGEIQKQSKYSIKIAAYDQEDNQLAYLRFGHFYESSAVYKPVVTITATITGSTLTWDEYPDDDTGCYLIYIEDEHGNSHEVFEDVDSTSFELDLKEEIDYGIKGGHLQNSKTYKISMVVKDYDGITLAKWSGTTFNYNSTATPIVPGEIKNAVISADGILSWDPYDDPDTDHYWIYIEDKNGRKIDKDEYEFDTDHKRDLKDDIDYAIKVGDLEKSGSYKISMVAEDDHGIQIGKWDGTTFEYDSPANLIIVGKIQNAVLSPEGILTWDAYAGADEYDIGIIDGEDGTYNLGTTSLTSFDLGSAIDTLIKNRVIDKVGRYPIVISASDEDGFEIGKVEKQFDYETTAEPIPIGQVSASISKTGVLTWTNYEDATDYEVTIASGDDSYILDFSSTDVLSVNLNAWIDRLIKASRIEKQSLYDISIVAYNKDFLKIGNWSTAYSYQSKAVPTDPDNLAASISDGILTWKSYTNAVDYEVSIDDDWGSSYSWPTPYNLKKKIDTLIKGGNIENQDSYEISIVAYDSYGFVLADWHDTFVYKSTATEVKPGKVTGFKFENGRMTWDAYAGASEYSVSIGETFHEVYVRVTVFQINEEIDYLIRSGDLKKKSPYNVSVLAYDSDGILVAEGNIDYNYDSSAEPYVVGSLTANITDGILTWEKYEGAVNYSVYIDGNGTGADGDSYDVNKRIDWLIKAGETTKQTSYNVAIAAEDSHGTVLASWETDYAYDSKATLVKPGKITGVKFSKGTMTWTAFKNAANYLVYVFDCPVYTAKASVAINSKIDWFIRARQITKSSPYPITIHAFDKEGIMIAEWNGSYKYTSKAVPFEVTTVDGISVTDGVMSWNNVLNAGEYTITVDDCYMPYTTGGSSFDLDGFIADLINMGFIGKQNNYLLTIKAFTKDGILLAEGTSSCTFKAGTLLKETDVTITGIEDKTYNGGNALVQDLVITYQGQQLVKGTDYEVYYSNNEDTGTASLTISFRHKYLGAIKKTFQINKAANPLSVKGKTFKVKAKKIKKKSLTVSISNGVKFVKNAGDPKVYKKKSGNKKIVINPTTGKITIKKKLKRGTYKVKVQITAQGNNNYEKSGTKTVTFKIKVK